ncbi:succinate dehydrogenase / fumarate reductase cytochrome b subunit [Tepidiforma thermophila]|uniref:Succinate dehydrogenase / fumarate reductase cytochrome b subunit n=1 Tax=Tepidiforma thermophila (strain KCTC 52669 / CGMCC 1.13589 / G233) TaxID=2761530 RepID=A0A2A9HJR1_TEPT2|nr:succinate dehydrogenase / fumarate reductase cytochrome b subunit [Tepidiforma thermophila]
MLSGTRARGVQPLRQRRVRPRIWILDFYGSAVGKKAVMAVTGIVLLGFVLVHMLGNLHLYEGAEKMNWYGEYLREIGEPILPRTGLLWIVRSVLIVAFALHIHAAVTLTLMNRQSRQTKYQGGRDYLAANYAARTMRWSGVIVGLFVIYHLMDLTWGMGGAEFTKGQPYENVVASLSRAPVAGVYIVANLLLGMHIYHGAWSLFQSLGWSHPRFNHWRRWFAVAFAAVIVIGNVSFPVAVLTGIVE